MIEPAPTRPAHVEVMPVVMEPVPAPAPTEDHASVPATPASPDEIGIVIPTIGLRPRPRSHRPRAESF